MRQWKASAKHWALTGLMVMAGSSFAVADELKVEVASPPPEIRPTKVEPPQAAPVAAPAAQAPAPVATPRPRTTAPAEAAAAPVEVPKPAQIIRERYADKTVKIERHVTQDAGFNFVNHGPWAMWDPSGHLVAKGEYAQGRRQGDWTRWFPSDAQPASGSDAEMIADPLEGTEFAGFKPPIVSRAKFMDDHIVGPWTIVDSEGRKLFSMDLAKNVPHGKASWWTPQGKLRREIEFKNGQLDGHWTEWDPQGRATREDRYIAGSRLAEVTLTHESGEKSAEGVYLYVRDELAVDLDWWSGLMEVATKPGQGKPLKQGKWMFWHEDGSKWYEAEFLDDKPVGLHTWWHKNGQKECEGRYEEGKPIGPWTYWHENGVQAAQGEFANGNKVGRWLKWNEEGRVTENTLHGPTQQAASPQRLATPPAQRAAQAQPGAPAANVTRTAAQTQAGASAPAGIPGTTPTSPPLKPASAVPNTAAASCNDCAVR